MGGDRYHATVIETDQHFLRCLVYIDLNMVRAGVVNHPSEWTYGGYNEIQNPRRKVSIKYPYQKRLNYQVLITMIDFEILIKSGLKKC